MYQSDTEASEMSSSSCLLDDCPECERCENRRCWDRSGHHELSSSGERYCCSTLLSVQDTMITSLTPSYGLAGVQGPANCGHPYFTVNQHAALYREHWRRRGDHCRCCCKEVRARNILEPRTEVIPEARICPECTVLCRLAATQPGTTYYSVKRFMGQQLADTKDLASSVSITSSEYHACW